MNKKDKDGESLDGINDLTNHDFKGYETELMLDKVLNSKVTYSQCQLTLAYDTGHIYKYNFSVN